MNIRDEKMSSLEFEFQEKIEIDYGNWPEIIGLIAVFVIILIMFISSDGSY